MALDLFRRGGTGNFYMRGTVRSIRVYESTGTEDYEAAEAIRIQTEARLLHESIFGRTATATFGEAAHAFIAAGGSARYLVGQTASGKPTGLVVRLSDKRLHTFTQAALDKLAAELYPEAVHLTKLRQFYAPFRAVWNYAATEGWAAERKWRMPRKPKGTRLFSPSTRVGNVPTSYDNAAAFVAAMAPAPAMVMTALFYTGMRPIELFTLQAESVSLAARWLVVTSSKTGEPRGVPIHEFLVPILGSLLKRQALADDGRLFRTHKGAPYPTGLGYGGGIAGSVKGARERSGIVNVSAYTARHTVSTQMVVNGVHPYVKDQILGHVADDMSRRYTNIPQAPLIEAINTLPVPQAWRDMPWIADPLAWSGKLIEWGDPAKRKASDPNGPALRAS